MAGAMRWLFLVASLFAIRAFGIPEQYCKLSTSRDTDVCIALSSYRNKNTKSNDLNVHMSAKFAGNQGWAAMGTGVVMNDSLMFVMYPSKDMKAVTLSVRSTSDHYPPTQIAEFQDSPKMTIKQSSVKDGTYDIQFICHACDKWKGTKIDFNGESRFIYAAYAGADVASDEVNRDLQKHTDNGVFYVNMPSIRSTSLDVPPIAPTRESTLDDRMGTQQAPSKSGSTSISLAFPIHGLALAIAFFFIMPLGAIMLRGGVENAFTWHWKVQLVGAGVALFGMLIGMYKSWGHPLNIFSLNGTHKFLGFLLFCSVLAQPALGYYHHKLYLQTKGPTTFGLVHRYLGRIVLVAGWINVNGGVFTAGAGFVFQILALVFAVGSAIALLYPTQSVGYLGRWALGKFGPAKYRTVDTADDDLDLPQHR